MVRVKLLLLGVGLCALPACTAGGSSSGGTAGTADATPVNIGASLYAQMAAEVMPTPDAVEQTVVIPNAVVRMDKKQIISAEVDGKIEIIGSPLPTGTVVDPKDASIYYDPNDKEKALPFRRLRIGNIVTKGQTVSLINDLDVLVQIEAAQKIKIASTKAINEARQGAEYVEEQVKILDKLGAAGSLAEKLNAQATLARYRENIFTSEREMAKADGDEKRAHVLRVKHRSMAAVTGIIINIMKEPGEQARVGEPIMEILSLEDVRIDGTMEAGFANLVQPGMKVLIEPTLPVGPDLKAGGIAHRLEVTGVAISSHPNRPLVISSSLDGTATVWDVKATGGGKSQTRLPHPVGVRSVTATGAKASQHLCATGGDDGRIRLWDITRPESISDKPMKEFTEAHAASVAALSFSPDGRHLASAAGRDVYIWDVATGKKLYAFPGEHKDAVTTVKFTPQAKLVTASRDKTIRVWSVGDKAASVDRSIDHRKANIDCVGVSSGGGRVLFDQDDGRLEVVSLADGQPVGSILNAAAGARFAGVAIFSPDDSYVLTAGGDGDMRGELQVWVTPKPGGRGAEVRRLVTPYRAMPTCADFGAGFIVVGTQAGSVHLWTQEMLRGVAKERIGRVVSVIRSDARNVKVRVETSAISGELGLLQDKSTATLIIRPGDQPAPLPGNAPTAIVPTGGIVVPDVKIPKQ